MADKQDRYRKRKSEQGFQRVEVLIPHDTAPLLKAYARALRDAHNLGLEPPLFDGMARTAPAQEDRARPTPAEPSTPTIAPVKPTARGTGLNTVEAKQRPDFSKGLLDE